MVAAPTTSTGLTRLGALLADPTRAEILCALMDGRAHTGTELARHVGVAASSMSEHLAKLRDGELVMVEAQGRHRYWRLSSPSIAELLESLGATASKPSDPRAPADLAYARTCYDHLAGHLAVRIYDHMVDNGHLHVDGNRLEVSGSGFDFLTQIGVQPEHVRASATRPTARSCLDWTQRRHHLAGAAGAGLLNALSVNGWIKAGARPRSLRVTELGRSELERHFGSVEHRR